MEADKIREDRYELRNRTQLLIMREIVWLHDLVFLKRQPRFFNDWFRLKHYLFRKYNIDYNNSFGNNDENTGDNDIRRKV